MELRHAIGDTLRTIRLEHNLTLREVSARSYVALGHISDIERGVKTASTEALEALALGLNISVSELIGEVYEYLKQNEEVSA